MFVVVLFVHALALCEWNKGRVHDTANGYTLSGEEGKDICSRGEGVTKGKTAIHRGNEGEKEGRSIGVGKGSNGEGQTFDESSLLTRGRGAQ